MIGIFSYIKTRSRYPKKLKGQLKKLLSGISPIDSGTQEMVTETRTLLNNIQHNVNIYIEKLNQIEKQIPVISSELERQQLPEKEIPTQKFKDHDELPHSEQPVPSSKSRYEDVNAEIDKLFETLHQKNT